MKVVIEYNEWYIPDEITTVIPPEASALLAIAVEATEDQVARFREAIQNFEDAKNAMIAIAHEIDPKC